MSKLHQLQIAEIKRETARASTIYLALKDEEKLAFQYRAGQYLTVEAEVDGIKERRAYSICTSPHESDFAFTVKEVDGGKMSTYLNQQVNTGDYLHVLAPQGKFTYTSAPDTRVTHYLLGAGSGITPLFSLTKDILESEPLSTVHLLYGNRHESDIIYHEDLISLTRKYEGQFHLQFYVSTPKARFVEFWNGHAGRLDVAELDKYLSDFPKQTIEEKFFICGPDQMIDQLTNHLISIGKGDHIYSERFNNKKAKMDSQSDKPTTSKAKIDLDGETVEIEVKDQSILQTLIDAGYDPPFSCTSGVCTTCMAKLKSGKVEMDVNYGLDEDEVADGYILTCQSHPTTEEIELTYDV